MQQLVEAKSTKQSDSASATGHEFTRESGPQHSNPEQFLNYTPGGFIKRQKRDRFDSLTSDEPQFAAFTKGEALSEGHYPSHMQLDEQDLNPTLRRKSNEESFASENVLERDDDLILNRSSMSSGSLSHLFVGLAVVLGAAGIAMQHGQPDQAQKKWNPGAGLAESAA